MIIILERDEAERLHYSSARFAGWGEQFRHTVHRTGLCLERDFDKVALSQRRGHLKQSSGG